MTQKQLTINPKPSALEKFPLKFEIDKPYTEIKEEVRKRSAAISLN